MNKAIYLVYPQGEFSFDNAEKAYLLNSAKKKVKKLGVGAMIVRHELLDLSFTERERLKKLFPRLNDLTVLFNAHAKMRVSWVWTGKRLAKRRDKIRYKSGE